jgi:hypothetical protein
MGLLHVWLTAQDVYPYYKWTGLLVAFLWGALGVAWRQPSMWILNAIIGAMYIYGMLR